MPRYVVRGKQNYVVQNSFMPLLRALNLFTTNMKYAGSQLRGFLNHY